MEILGGDLIYFHTIQEFCASNYFCQLLRMMKTYPSFLNKDYGIVGYRRSWGHECVDLHDEHDQLITIPLAWTDAAAPDPFVVKASGRSYFRTEDLIRLVHFIEGFRQKTDI